MSESGLCNFKPNDDELGQACVGSVYRAENRSIWKFESDDPNNKFHPGVCYEFIDRTGCALLLKGTSKVPRAKYMKSYVSVMPDDHNGLDRETFFKLFPFSTRRHIMRRLHGFGLIGELKSDDLAGIRNSMNCLLRSVLEGEF
jgi:hypothetical protein